MTDILLRESGAIFFTSWHNLLSSSETPRGICIELCADAIAYLIGDDSRLPAPSNTQAIPLLFGDARHALLLCHDVELFSPSLPIAEKALYDALVLLGGDGVLPRACGTAPADACWACPGGDASAPLRASAVSDIWTLLKASDRVRDAIVCARTRGQVPWIDLREWHRIDSSTELRVFLSPVDGSITAMSQRRLHETPSPRLESSLIHDGGLAIRARLTKMFQNRGITKFAVSIDGEGGVGGLFVDVFMKFGVSITVVRPLILNVNRYYNNDSYRKIDGSLLFSWEEIETLAAISDQSSSTTTPQLRLISGSSISSSGGASDGGASGGGGGGIHFAPLAAHAFPDEVFDFARIRMGDNNDNNDTNAAVLQAATNQRGKLNNGWAALIEGLESQGLFSSQQSDSSDEDDAKVAR